MVIEELLQFLVAKVDAQLFKAVVVEDLKSGDVKDANERNPANTTILKLLPLLLKWYTYFLMEGSTRVSLASCTR